MRVPAALKVLPLLALLAAAGGGAAAAAAPSPAPGEVQGAGRGTGDATTKDSAGPEKRIAFVVGDGSYAAGPLPTAANDAGLIAQTLQAAGFEVMGARDLDGETLRQSYVDFLHRLGEAGPNTVAFVYLAGYGLQYGDSNYFVPVGAAVTGAIDIPVQSLRLSDLMGPLAALPLKARFAVFDAAYRAPFSVEGTTVGGFSLVDAAPGTLVAFNAAPGTAAAAGTGNFGLYAIALASTLRQPGLAPEELFDRVRLRVSAGSGGAEVPWDVSKVDESFRFFDAAKDETKGVAGSAPTPQKSMLAAPLRDLPVDDAFSAAVARDTFEAYSAFSTDFAASPLAKRIRILLALRREALTWHDVDAVDTPAAYWSYLARYERGPHAGVAHRRLAELSAAASPPAGTELIRFDVPPPPAEESAVVERAPADVFASVADLPPVPQPPAGWLPTVPSGFTDRIASPSGGLFALPTPAFLPLPADVDPPAGVAYPAGNAFFASSFGGGVPFGGNVSIGNRMVVSRIHRAAEGGGLTGVALPAAAGQRSAALERRGIVTAAQLEALRMQPGGVVAMLATRDDAAPAVPHRQAQAALETGRSVLTGTDARDRDAGRPVDRIVEPNAGAPAPATDRVAVPEAAPVAAPAVPLPPRRARVDGAVSKKPGKASVAAEAKMPSGDVRPKGQAAPQKPRIIMLGHAEKGKAGAPLHGAQQKVAALEEHAHASPAHPLPNAPRTAPGNRRDHPVAQVGPFFGRPPIGMLPGPRYGMMRGGPPLRLGPDGFPLRRFAGGPPPGYLVPGRPLRMGPHFLGGGPRPGGFAGGPPPEFGGEYGGGFGSSYGGGFGGRF